MIFILHHCPSPRQTHTNKNTQLTHIKCCPLCHQSTTNTQLYNSTQLYKSTQPTSKVINITRIMVYRSNTRDLVGSALDHRSLPSEFESLRRDIWRVFHLWLRFITFGGRSAHLAYHVRKSGRKTSINQHTADDGNKRRIIGCVMLFSRHYCIRYKRHKWG